MKSQSGQWLACVLHSPPFECLLSGKQLSSIGVPNPFMGNPEQKASGAVWISPACEVVHEHNEISDILPFFRRNRELMNHFLGMHGILFELARGFVILLQLFHCRVPFSHSTVHKLCPRLHTLLNGLHQVFDALRSKARMFDAGINAISRNGGRSISTPLWSLLATRIENDIEKAVTLLQVPQTEGVSGPIPQSILQTTDRWCAFMDQMAPLICPAEVMTSRQRARELDHAAAQANRYADRAQRHMTGGNPGEAVHCFSLAIELNPSSPELSIGRAEAADLESYSTGNYDRHYRQVRLKYVDLANERKVEEVASHISLSPFCWSISIVELTQVGLTSKGVLHLTPGLLKCSGLRRLSLTHNEIDDEGVASLSHLLAPIVGEVSPKITELYLASNRVTSKGVIALAGALGSNSSLTILDLSCNLIDDLGAEALVESVLANSKCSLQTVDLCGNHIGEEGVCALARLVREKQPFVDVSLGRSEDGPTCSEETWLEFQSLSAARRRQGRHPSVTELSHKAPFSASQPALLVVQKLMLESLHGQSNQVDLLQAFRTAKPADFWPLIEHCERTSRTLWLPDRVNLMIATHLEAIHEYEAARLQLFRATVGTTDSLEDLVSLILSEHREWLLQLWSSDEIPAQTRLNQTENPLVESLGSRVQYFASLLKAELGFSHAFRDLLTELIQQLQSNKARVGVDHKLSQIGSGLREVFNVGRRVTLQLLIYLVHCQATLSEKPSDASLLNLLSSLATVPHADVRRVLAEVCAFLTNAQPTVTILHSSYLSALFPLSQLSKQSGAPPPSQGELSHSAVFRYGITQSAKRQILPSRVVNTCGPLYSPGELVMAYLKMDQEPFAATIVKYNGNGTYHVRFQNGESNFRYSEQDLMTRDWQPKVRLQPDLLVWMEPSQTKSKTKSHLFSMYKNVEVDEFSGFVLQKLKKEDAKEAHRAPVRIISGTTYPFWEVANSESLEEARSLHWKYIKEIAPALMTQIAKEDRAEWIVAHIKQLIHPATASSETAQALNWLAGAKPQAVDLEFTERLAESINSDLELLEKDEIQAFLQEWCSHHRVVNVDFAIRDFFEQCTKELDGKISRKRLVDILTTPVPSTLKAPPPPPPSSPIARDSVVEVKLNLEPYLERLHGIVACLLPLVFALGFEVPALDWLHPRANRALSALMQWTSSTCQTVAGCVKLLEDAFENFAKTESLLGVNTLGTSRPPKLLTKAIFSTTSQAVQDLELLRELLTRIGQHHLAQELQSPSSRGRMWEPIAEEAIKVVRDFIPKGIAAPIDSADQPSCSCTIDANAAPQAPLTEPPIPVPEIEQFEVPDINQMSTPVELSPKPINEPTPQTLNEPTPKPQPKEPTPQPKEPTPQPKEPTPQPQKTRTAPPPPPNLPTSSSRILIRVGLPKGFSSTQTKMQVSSADTVASLKTRLLAKFGPTSSTNSSWMLLHHSVEVADNEALGNRSSFSLQPSTSVRRQSFLD